MIFCACMIAMGHVRIEDLSDSENDMPPLVAHDSDDEDDHLLYTSRKNIKRSRTSSSSWRNAPLSDSESEPDINFTKLAEIVNGNCERDTEKTTENKGN